MFDNTMQLFQLSVAIKKVGESRIYVDRMRWNGGLVTSGLLLQWHAITYCISIINFHVWYTEISSRSVFKLLQPRFGMKKLILISKGQTWFSYINLDNKKIAVM